MRYIMFPVHHYRWISAGKLRFLAAPALLLAVGCSDAENVSQVLEGITAHPTDAGSVDRGSDHDAADHDHDQHSHR